MGIVSSNKQIDRDKIECGEKLKVTISLSAEPDILSKPADMALLLDRSGSMAGAPLLNLKVGAKTFIDIMDESTDGEENGDIGSGSRIGIISFANTATVNTQLITSTEALKEAVDSLSAGGSTNHADAFAKAIQLLSDNSQNRKIIVMFTDGKTTAGPPPAFVAQAAKESGIIIYCIGLTGSDGISVDTLNDWASDPDDVHVAVTPNEEELEKLFREIAESISKAGATEIVIDEVIADSFKIDEIISPDKGEAEKLGDSEIRWKIEKLGVSGKEEAKLEFFIEEIAFENGLVSVNESITYTDKEGHKVEFPDIYVNVDCRSDDTVREECPEPLEITICGCRDSAVFDLGDVAIQSQGRVIQLNVTVKNVCPNKRVALAAVLTEEDEHGIEHNRGLKTLTIPAHNRAGCRDVMVKCIKFVLPEDLNENSCGCICNKRHLKARFFANYIDTDFKCCDEEITVIDCDTE